jgi:predicted nuclease of restriction endonuclease-like (RecB) superfamily
MKELDYNKYNKFVQEILTEIQDAKNKAAYKINESIIQLYFRIGEVIVEKQTLFGWGKSIVEKLSIDLKNMNYGMEGYSVQNLWYMRQFYLSYKNNSNLLQFAYKIPWGQNILIISKIKNPEEQKYYLSATKELSWSRSVLLNQIKAGAFENYMIEPTQNNFNVALPKHITEQAEEMLKSNYNLDFLDISKPIHERHMENKMVAKIKKLLLELGYGFTFIGNQFKLKGNKKNYYIDLLFFHRKLKCLVAIELKATEFKAEYAGKMNLYLNLLDNQIKMEDENPSIGIILCAEKDNFEVEFSLKGIDKPMGVAEYSLTRKLPKKYQGYLPTVEELKREIDNTLSNN